MSLANVELIAGGALLLLSAVCGCGDGDSMPASPSSSGGSVRMIPLGGAEYFLKSSAASSRCNDRCEGLQPLGDIDKDGSADVVVALNRKGASAPAEHTWIEAYSGGDGRCLWSLQGKYDRDLTKCYTLGPLTVLDDIDADAIADVYCSEVHNRRSAFLISGRTGNLIGWHALERKPIFSRPLLCRDYNGDGTPDLYFSRNNVKPLTVAILSGKDLKEIARLENLWPAANNGRVEWALSIFHDENADGVADCLARRMLPHKGDDAKSAFEYAVLDGKNFAPLRTFKSPRPRVTAKTYFASVGDLNADRIGDFVFSSGAGGGPQGRSTLLRAVSAADGSVIWDVTGDQLGIGAEIWSVDAKTGAKTAQGRDAGFGNHLVGIPDRNGDDVDDIAALADAAAADGPRAAVLVVSGKTGEIISTLDPSDRQGRLMHNAQIVRLPLSSTDKSPAIAVTAREPDGAAAVAVFDGD